MLVKQICQYVAEDTLNEIVSKEELTDIDDVIQRLQHCKRALSMANKLSDPADRKKWQGAALANMNRVRAALVRLIAQVEKLD
jgi:hypothetical protein